MTAPAELTVHTDLTREDLWAFVKFLDSWLPQRRRGTWTMRVSTLVILTLLGVALFPDSPGTIVAWVVTLGAILLIGGEWSRRRQVMGIPFSRNGTLGQHHLSISPVGIHETNPFGEQMRYWTGVTDVVEDKNYIYLFIDAMEAYIAPKRAFPNPEEALRFFATATQLWKSGTQTQSTS